ncbi:MAG: B12-binding domain-containing radical SAM protein [Candidatus Zixiibacteriota bacterium]|nr:MAG: B12-binding domain-containing radical SAM protein [candidate division Zixibacteria bacterium]
MKKALLIHPEFSPYGFWNYKDVCKLVGAKYPAAPLGMITLAALLPQEWNIRLIDMNTSVLRDSDIGWADLVFIGGMLPQQVNILKLMNRVHNLGKKVVVGGPDPTSQPDIYQDADYLVLGEAEDTINRFLQDLDRGVERGAYLPQANKPDITKSPIPRFDLLNFKDYIMIGIQFSRGCPFNCEFCDVIELFGRNPRTKTPEQIINELDTLYKLGYRGHVDFVDDNFIGHKTKSKEILGAIKRWSEDHDFPFYFSTEASINLADDEELLSLMEDIDLRYLFIGIESADENVLKSTRKKQNLNRKLKDDLYKIYRHGMVVNGGFIIGFDNETSDTARLIVDSINDGKICMSMIGLLYALPNTQLTRRLSREKRLFENSSLLDRNCRNTIDQATSGLNFITLRPRSEIINDYIYILEKIYSRKNYFDNCLKFGKILRNKRKHKPRFIIKLSTLYSFLKLINKIGIRPSTIYYFWRNILIIMLTRPSSIEEAINLMAMYIHFRKQTEYIVRLMNGNLKDIAVRDTEDQHIEFSLSSKN